MDADWAALNAAQQAALILWVPLALFVGWKIATRSMDRGWPFPLIVALIMIFGCAGAGLLTLVLGDVPK